MDLQPLVVQTRKLRPRGESQPCFPLCVLSPWPGRQHWCWQDGRVPGGSRLCQPTPLTLALQIPSGGGGGTREPAPHLLPGTAAAGGGEGHGPRRGARRWGAGWSWSPPGAQSLAFSDHRRAAGLHTLLAARDQDRRVLEPAVPVPLPGHCGPRWALPSRHRSPLLHVSAGIPLVPETPL